MLPVSVTPHCDKDDPKEVTLRILRNCSAVDKVSRCMATITDCGKDYSDLHNVGHSVGGKVGHIETRSYSIVPTKFRSHRPVICMTEETPSMAAHPIIIMLGGKHGVKASRGQLLGMQNIILLGKTFVALAILEVALQMEGSFSVTREILSPSDPMSDWFAGLALSPGRILDLHKLHSWSFDCLGTGIMTFIVGELYDAAIYPDLPLDERLARLAWCKGCLMLIQRHRQVLSKDYAASNLGPHPETMKNMIRKREDPIPNGFNDDLRLVEPCHLHGEGTDPLSERPPPTQDEERVHRE
mmetsp:Transcript_30874/g.60812  ORF Transcript_30874/g.60812 Transcript_30874/m.60812 type:complete len:298 (+) Transcript_30874:467-1360(+)